MLQLAKPDTENKLTEFALIATQHITVKHALHIINVLHVTLVLMYKLQLPRQLLLTNVLHVTKTVAQLVAPLDQIPAQTQLQLLHAFPNGILINQKVNALKHAPLIIALLAIPLITQNVLPPQLLQQLLTVMVDAKKDITQLQEFALLVQLVAESALELLLQHAYNATEERHLKPQMML